MKSVPPGALAARPAVSAILLARLQRRRRLACAAHDLVQQRVRVLGERNDDRAHAPHDAKLREPSPSCVVAATIGASGRCRATARAVAPDCVTGTIAASRRSAARSHTAALTASCTLVRPPSCDPTRRRATTSSAVCGDARHRLRPPPPGSRRPRSRRRACTASARSKIALATSLASARVGRGAVVIESSICVATTTGLPAAARLGDDAALQDGHLLRRRLDAEIAARDHDRVGAAMIGVEIRDRLVLLDLGDDGHVRSSHQRAQGRDVVGASARTTGRRSRRRADSAHATTVRSYVRDRRRRPASRRGR